jgi:subtilisin family serine protease
MVNLALVRRAGCHLLVAGLIGFMTTSSHAGIIQLKNERVDTESGANRTVMAVTRQSAAAADGLYLVQFNGAVDPARRAEWRKAGVELIQYVPDDAFIAKFIQIAPATVAGWKDVTWVGPYRPEHKIHSRLALAAPLAARSNQTVKVNILLAPNATLTELAAVRKLLAAVDHESRLRQGTIVRGALSPGQLAALAELTAVLWIEPAPKRKLVDEAAAKIVGGDDGAVATPTVTQQLGFDGRGVTVCVADTGLDTGNTNTMHPDLRGRVTGFQFYAPLTDGSDGYGHGTHCAGIVAGNAGTGETDPDTGQFYGLGVASGANIFVERIFDSDANEVDFTSDETLTRDAVRAGAKIGSNSWGNDVAGEYDTDCAQFDELVRDADAGTAGYQPYILEFSAGNAGPNSQTIGSPACAKNVIATGASQNDPATLASTYGLYAEGRDTMADFSSRGPCADGRIKPDLVAPGTWIASAASRNAFDLANTSWTVIDDFYVYMGGTSMAGPHAAGAAAVFVQFYRATHTNATPSPALVKAALINSADELDQGNGGPGPVPNNDEGWGRINLENIITTNFSAAPRAFQYVDQTALLTNGQLFTQHIFVRSAAEPLKVTLAYTDVPGFPGALPALVNDLDLEVVAPDGTLYRGNQFGAGESVPNAPSSDKLNNVEGVLLAAPVPGDYLVRVRGTKIVADALPHTAAVDQDFALVVSGDEARAGEGIILLDRPAYTAPGTMHLLVFDAARIASNSASVTVTNLTRHGATAKFLNAQGNYGAFTGAVVTLTTVPPRGGAIQVAHGDLLAVDYSDAGNVRRRATAVADLIPPVISAVATSTDLGVLTVAWQTSEPATSLVRYGTNSANLNLAVTNSALVTAHVVKLTRLVPGRTYYFSVSSADAAGNAATNNNAGANLTFTGIATPIVLLVDAYDTAAEDLGDATVIPDSTYTNALNAAGVSYAFWKVNTRGGYPQLADLKPYPVVMWRLTDDAVYYGVDDLGLPDPTATNNTLNARQQFMIQSYLNGGGSFFLASMGILSQVGDTPFRREVLQVAGFSQNPAPPFPCSGCDEDAGVPGIFGGTGTVANAMYQTLDYANYPSFDDGFGDFFGPDFSDVFTPSSSATTITYATDSGRPCGMSYPAPGVDSPGRVVFLSFPFDALPTSGASNNAAALLKNAVAFLAPGADGRGVLLLDNTLYTTNTQVTVQVGDADLIGAGATTATFGASSRTNRTVVTLYETAHPGLFTGYLTLVAGPAGAAQLRVQPGDLITATYADASPASNIVVTALVDTVRPVITNVAAVTDYYNAQITWKTSKPSDSAVQFNDLSQPPANVVYSATLVTNHSVTLNNLLPNRVYRYAVVSRDQAGNTTVDNNGGNYYLFQTLTAPKPPWFDNLEGDPSGWTVRPDPATGTDLNWTLGTPNNGLATSARSGTNAWGGNLKGNQNFTLVRTYLYAPIIDLSGLKSATLTFSNVYDFSRTISIFGFTFYAEDGGIFVSTNNNVPPSLNLPLGLDFADQTAYTWQKETVNLDQFCGQTIRVVFYYEANAIGLPAYGWTIDDIAITGVVAGGNVTITKNLGQGAWTLSSLSPLGPTPVQSGVAPAITLSNVPTGNYLLQFGDVPYYLTPASQTNMLVTDATLNFTGNYTFPDANHNGISDAWEIDYFGGAVTNRTQLTDTDRDGMTDYAEFIAGTIPTNAASRLYFTSEFMTNANTRVRMQWPVVTNRLYQVHASTNLAAWTPVTPWRQATNGPTMRFTGTNSARTQFFRVQVLP